MTAIIKDAFNLRAHRIYAFKALIFVELLGLVETHECPGK